MTSKKSDKWLKKYTKIKYLESILEHRQLHLGDPACWDDKNDSELIQYYLSTIGKGAIRSTCLTSAIDRYHFWAIFGGESLGVCLWFDPEKLQQDIRADESLIARDVQYSSEKSLREIQVNKIPFLKREQYRDEKEFRVLKVYPGEAPPSDGFKFSASSLKKVYLNSWLAGDTYTKQFKHTESMLTGDYGHVKLCQNRVLKHKPWIDAVKNATNASSN